MLKKEFLASVEVYPQVSAWVEEELGKINCPLQRLLQISMCLEEAFINIAHYAYGEGTGKVVLEFGYRDGVVTLCLRDKGIPFNPLEKEKPVLDATVEDREVGGLGIYLVKTMMDSVNYAWVNGENVLTFSKKLE